MADEKRPGNQWRILATEAPADERRRVLKHEDTFGVFDSCGDTGPARVHGAGIYHGDTRFLSRQELRIEGRRPLYLNSMVRDDNDLFAIELTNPDLHLDGTRHIPKGLLRISRLKLLWEGACYERVRVVSFALEAVDVTLSMEFGADYADIFEVRGFQRGKRGQDLPPEIHGNRLVLGYRGLDQAVYRTHILCELMPQRLTASRAEFRLALPPKGETNFFTTVASDREGRPASFIGDYASV